MERDYKICPNKCGDLVMLDERPNMFHLMPPEIIEIFIMYQDSHPEEAAEVEEELTHSFLAGVCKTCGFVLVITR